MEKIILEQYADLIAEREDLKKRIRATKLKIERLCEDTVADTVSLGKHGKKHLGRKVIRGAPSQEIEKKRRALQKYTWQLKTAENRISDMIVEAQQYIDEIEDSRIRRIFRYRYIDKMSWVQVAMKMGRHHTAESCRIAAERYLGKRK